MAPDNSWNRYLPTTRIQVESEIEYTDRRSEQYQNNESESKERSTERDYQLCPNRNQKYSVKFVQDFTQ